MTQYLQPGTWTVQGILSIVTSSAFLLTNNVFATTTYEVTNFGTTSAMFRNSVLPLINSSLSTALQENGQGTDFHPSNICQTYYNNSAKIFRIYYIHNADWSGTPDLTFQQSTFLLP